jgi:sulfur carrier protein ThiS
MLSETLYLDEGTMRRVVRYGLGVVLAVGLVLGLLVAVVGLGVGGVYPHDHGTLEVTVDGETIDFDRSAYHDRHPTLHFHEGGGNEWHHHPESPLLVLEFERMTVAEALETLDVVVTDSTATVDGVSYDDADPDTTVAVTVDGEPVDPAEHLLQDGDAVAVRVTSE